MLRAAPTTPAEAAMLAALVADWATRADEPSADAQRAAGSVARFLARSAGFTVAQFAEGFADGHYAGLIEHQPATAGH